MIIEFVTGGMGEKDVLVVPVQTGGMAAVMEKFPENFRAIAAGVPEQARFE